MSNLKTELKALWRITKFFGEIALVMAFSWVAIVSLWAVFG